MSRLIRYLRGSVRFRLTGAAPEQWAERKAPGVQEFSFDSYVTLSSPAGGGTLLTLWKGVSALCLDAPGGRVWLDQPEGADLAAALLLCSGGLRG